MVRVTELSAYNNFLDNYQRIKNQVSSIQEQISTQRLVNKPSDNPAEIGAILRLQNSLGDISSYRRNIDNGIAQVNTTTAVLEDFYAMSEKLKADLSELKNTPSFAQYDVLSQGVQDTMTSFLELSNSKFEGKYLFAGTDYAQEPFAFNSASGQYQSQSQNIAGDQLVKIGNGINVNLRVDGSQLFSSVIKQFGNFDKSAELGSTATQEETLWDADGNEYTFSMLYTKTNSSNNFAPYTVQDPNNLVNTYDMEYTIKDASGATVSTQLSTLEFDSNTGLLRSIDGNPPRTINISIPEKKINFYVDLTSLSQANKPEALYTRQNQKADIFNTLKSIKEKLDVEQKPSDNQLQLVDNFTQVVLNRLTEMGNATNKLDDTEALLKEHDLYVQDLLSRRNDTDVAKASIDLQNRQYNLDVMYKVASTILPKSLMDYF